MYVPPHFAEHDLAALRDAIERFPLATLVTGGPDGLHATHLPFLYEPEPPPYGRLVGHVARANPQWRGLAADPRGLAIFGGPDAYITPMWYEDSPAAGRTVPTWDYIAVHASGTLAAFDDRDRLHGLVARLTELFERGREQRWSVDESPPDYTERQLRGIVGVELRIERIDGAWKLSQNRSERERANVERELLTSPSDRERAAGEEMQRLRRREQ